MRRIRTGILLGLFIGALSAPAQAVPILVFDQVNNSGTVSYDGAGGPAVGANIVFESILGVGTPDNNGVLLTCQDCFLDFETGGNISEGPAFWQFGAGGTFVLEGQAFDGATLVASGVLLSGSFSSNPFRPSAFGAGSTLAFTGFGVDSKNQDLLDFYGITNNNFRFINQEMSFSATIDSTTGAFTGDVDNADLTNTVPEPASMLLLGTGLLGLAASRRRRVNA